MTLMLALAALAGAAAAAPWIDRGGRSVGWLLAIAPLAAFILLATHLPAVAAFQPVAWIQPWYSSLGGELALRLDGLGLLMALLVTGVGALIVIYAGAYLQGHPLRGRFYLYLMGFMGAMLGLVLADNVILLFVFWELTSITSYLLIGFNHEKEEARWKSLQALLVTGFGGVAMLAGLILAAEVAGSWRISEIVASGDVLRAHAWYPAITVLILLGAFTKSAQVPFHFWLPNAMAAPTPVSAFLHSATMVKAGIYLMARFSPGLGETGLWQGTLIAFGATTFLTGAILGIGQTDLKRILAFTTLAVLGLLTMLIGVGTELAMQSAMLFLLGHALYKAALFMTAGSIDHETGTREVTQLGGLRRAMPWTAAAAGLAALSKAGFPPFFGFIGKEYVYKSGLAVESLAPVLVAVAVGGNMLLLALALKAGIHPFWGKRSSIALPKSPHEAPRGMWVGPLLLAVLGLLAGLFPGLTASWLIGPAVSAMAGEPLELKVALWHGFNLPLLLSAVTVTGGIALYVNRVHFWTASAKSPLLRAGGVERVYERLFHGTVALAGGQTRFLQSGYLRNYVLILLGSVGLLLGYKFLTFGIGLTGNLANVWDPLPLGLTVAMIALSIYAASAESRLSAILSLGGVGFGVALLFLYFGAPDLAITQLCVETLTVVLFVFVVYRLPVFRRLSSRRTLIRDAVFAGLFGLLMTAVTLKALSLQLAPTISSTLTEWSYLEAKGRNVVNVILVDFRALDTFGEIVVLGIAALGIATLAAKRNNGGGQGGDPMSSIILNAATRILMPLLLVLSVVILYRGHNLPGGGFIGGLVAAAAIVLAALGGGTRQARGVLRIEPRFLIVAGLATALSSTLWGPLLGGVFMEGVWLPTFSLPLLGKVHLGTPLIFDVGVYMTVVGFTLKSTFNLAEMD